jgi:hypothetical protein
MTEHPRDATDNDGTVTYWPDHFAPATWLRCIAEGCTARLDPWAHITRCPRHQAEQTAALERQRERVHAIVREYRDAERRKIDARG